MRRLSPRIAVLALILALFVGWSLPAAGQPVVGEQAPGFSLPALDGATVSLESHLGRTVVLHFGAGW